MGESPDRFTRWPRWLADGLFGLGVTVVGVFGLSTGWAGVFAALSPVSVGDPATGFQFASLAWYLLAMGSFVVLYAGWSLGLTVGYRCYRDLGTGPLVERPGSAAVRCLAGTGSLAVVLIAGATVSSRGSTGPLRVPVLLVGDPAAPLPTYEGLGGLAGAMVPGLVIGAALGIAVGALLPGVLQASLRRSAPRWVAIGLPALALPVLFGETSDPLALAVLIAYAGVVGLAYDHTRNLLVPMAAYAMLDLTVLAATLLLLQ